MENKTRKAIRAQREQLLTLVNGWDPVGVLRAGGPRDEYDYLVDELLGLLSRNATREEIAEFLEREVSGHFGKTPKDAAQFANKAIAWFQLLEREQ